MKALYFLFFSNFIFLVHTFTVFDLSTCDTKKSCLKYDSTCTATTCLYAVTWVTVGSYLEIELLGTIDNSAGYLAVGFSLDSFMGNDDVIACIMPSDQLQLKPGYNTKAGNTYLTSAQYSSTYLQDATNDATLGGRFDSSTNRLYCRFRRALVDSKSTTVFDLTSQNYYVLMARGSRADSTGLSPHFATSVSSSSLNLTAIQKVQTGTVTYPIAKAHGTLMILAWVMFASIGIVSARYFKDMWPDCTIGDKKVWFLLHVACQMFCFLCVLVAFIIIFIEVKGYSSSLDGVYALHPILGIIVFCLAFINPILGFIRCDPKHPKRPIFNCVHFFIGTLAYVLAVPTMMLGLRLNKAGTTLVTLDYPLAILIAFVGFQATVEIILIIHSCVYRSRSNSGHNGMPEKYNKKVNKARGATIKSVIGAIHTSVSIAIAIALVVIIAMN